MNINRLLTGFLLLLLLVVLSGCGWHGGWFHHRGHRDVHHYGPVTNYEMEGSSFVADLVYHHDSAYCWRY